MLKKNLVKVAVTLVVGFSLNACGQTQNPNSVSRIGSVEKSQKKMVSGRWQEFQQGFNNKTTVSSTVFNARVSIGGGNETRKVTMADRINSTKWKEFQKSFTERAEYYTANITSAFK
ncbi:MAG: hypothetical protein H7263_05040 [Candidatus Sericytochromatia bacterium]|nr:hypothetical protein [Candidatus Sericytochromatia bacterium]